MVLCGLQYTVTTWAKGSLCEHKEIGWEKGHIQEPHWEPRPLARQAEDKCSYECLTVQEGWGERGHLASS